MTRGLTEGEDGWKLCGGHDGRRVSRSRTRQGGGIMPLLSSIRSRWSRFRLGQFLMGNLEGKGPGG